MTQRRSLFRDDRGATIVEFGLLLPVILTTFLGVLQIGLTMLAHNSIRNMAAEGSRAALVAYQNSNELPEATIRDNIIALAAANSLETDRLTVQVTRAATQRVDGAIEMTIAINYDSLSVLQFIGIQSWPTSYTRPLFLIDETIATI